MHSEVSVWAGRWCACIPFLEAKTYDPVCWSAATYYIRQLGLLPFVLDHDFSLASIPDNIASFCIDVAMVCMKNTYTHNNNDNIYMCDIWIKFVTESRGLSLGNFTCEDLN